MKSYDPICSNYAYMTISFEFWTKNVHVYLLFIIVSSYLISVFRIY